MSTGYLPVRQIFNMSNIQHKDNTQLYILTTGQSIDSLIPFSSPADEYHIAFEDRASLMLIASAIAQSRGHTPLLDIQMPVSDLFGFLETD